MFTSCRFRCTLVKLSLVIASLAALSMPAAAEPIGWMEGYALASDREAKLSELIPGSDDYYFYHCLHYQTTGQLERSETMLRDWLAEHKGRETPSITAMIDRQRLLTYNDSPQRTIDHLVRRLGIKLDHAPPATKNQRRFPSQFDQAALAVDRIVKDALRRNDQLKPLGIQYLANQFLRGNTAGISISLRDLLARVRGPYVNRLDELVIKDLASRRANEKRFGDVRAHSYLTLDELRKVGAAIAEVADDNQFVSATLRRMRPGADSDLSQQPEVRIEYLTRVEAYLRSLPASYNSMKASAAYRLLEANLHRGVFDRALFLRYLQLPRVSPIVPAEWARRGGQRANLNENFMDIALLPPIGNEEPLVRTHLEHFLRDAENTDAFSRFLKPEYLRRIFAETKLLGGIGREDQWYKMLSASQRQAIRDAVTLRLAPTNPKRFASDQPARLIADVKNIDELVIRIYEINTASYYRTHTKAIDTDIDLDGLVATHEKKLTYNQPAVQRHREQLELPEISGRGVWVVDLVGKGVRARALVRRGAIHHVDSENANGMVFTIIDENRKPIPTATMWVGSRQFAADDRGRIVLPPVVDRVSRRAIVSDGQIATQISFGHLRERYSLRAGIHVDRTQLQSGGEAELLIRPRLMMANTPIDPKTLKDVEVRLEASDLDGISTTHQIDGLQLDQNGELVVPIRVPSRLVSLSVTLSGKVDGLADGKERTLSTSRTWDIAGIRRTSYTHDTFLTRDGDRYVIEVRGRNGELIPRATVAVSLTTPLRNAVVDQTLQSDENGQVHLGELSGVNRIAYSIPGGLRHERDLNLDQVRWADEIHTTEDRPIQLPLVETASEAANRYRLLEVRAGSYHADHSGKLKYAKGLLTIQKLAAGDYHLIDRSNGSRRTVAVVEGPTIGSVAAGQVRHRSLSPALPLGIESITRDETGLKIKLSGKTKAARVHVYASRFLEQTVPIGQLYLPLPSLRGRRVTSPFSGYVSDLRLGDEYQYVLRRRYANKYPGVMLPQPSILLNPWETEETSNLSQAVRAGDAPPPSARSDSQANVEAELREAQQEAKTTSSDYDFLADPGAVVANLRPDDEGVVTVPNELIEGLPVLQIIACDPATILQRTVTGALEKAETFDLRLAKALDAEIPYSFERGVSIASGEQPLDLESLGSAQLQVYASVGDLWKLYKTLVNDSRLNEFDQLSIWHTLDRDAKLDAYSRLASHELHLFLWFHDRSFFDQAIHPYLENKKEKQFMDHWLLGHDLSDYARLWRYNQLNAAERALLAMRLPEARQTVLRELRETIENQEEDYAAILQGIESALKSSRFEVDSDSDGLEFDAEIGEAFGEALMEAEAMDGAVTTRMRRGGATRRLRLQVEAKKAMAFADNGVDMFGGRAAGGGLGGGAAFFRNLDSTKQWAESHWDRVRTVGGPLPASLIGINPYWSDLADQKSGAPTVSPNLLRPIESRHAALVALATCGLPLTAGEVGLPTEDAEDYAPEHAVAVVTKRLKQLEPSDPQTSILIGQRFESVSSAASRSRSKPLDEPLEFLTGAAYRGHVVVSNPTAEQRVVDVFWQIPAGSLPVAGNQRTDSRTITLQPFAVQAISYEFYFPAAGTFKHYPATVAADHQLIAQAAEKEFPAVEQFTDQQAITWEKIAETADAERIEEFLATANLREIDWMRIAHRMKDQDVYKVVIKVLGQAKLPIAELWGYSFVHRDDEAMETYLSIRGDLVQRTGPVLNSPLLKVEPIERRMFEMLEYAPLVRARIHRLGAQDEILNPTFHRQYESFTRVLGFSDEISPGDRMVLVYYLLIQNRIAEAIEEFEKVDSAAVDSQLQFDYLDSYLALHREQFDRAERIGRKHADHPVPRWSLRFTELLSQLRQRRNLNETEKLVSVEGSKEKKPIAEGSGDLSVLDRERRQAQASDQQPEVIVRVEGDSLRIDHRQAKDVVLNFYGVDLELLFSKAPFVREDLERMAMVRPSRSEAIRFDASTGVGRFDLDDNLRRQTLLVEVVAGAARSTALYYGGDITTYISESFGQLQTSDANSHRPIATAYVKVYAKYANGGVRFYKDGYTDARGRFDYASISAADAKGATRFAILVISEEKGATLHDVAAPNQ